MHDARASHGIFQQQQQQQKELDQKMARYKWLDTSGSSFLLSLLSSMLSSLLLRYCLAAEDLALYIRVVIPVVAVAVLLVVVVVGDVLLDR